MKSNVSIHEDAYAAIEDLCSHFFGRDLAGTAHLVSAAELPPEYRRLLHHHDHMTTTLAAYHGATVAVRVLDEHIDGDDYERKIVLMPNGTGHVIEVGVVRINLGYTSDEVRAEILRRVAPLGDILIRHNVLRRIEPRWYLRFDPHGPIPAAFERHLSEPVYGRLGTIYCDDEPAIELLEVVDADKVRSSP